MRDTQRREPSGDYLHREEHRGSLPQLTKREQRLAVGLAILQAGCVRLGVGEPFTAEFPIPGSDRSVTIIGEIKDSPDQLALTLQVDDVDEQDLPAVERIHERICALVPSMAAAVVEQREEVA